MDKRKQGVYEQTGILQPVLMYRWRVRFPNESVERGNLISTNAVKLSIDYSTSEFHLTVRQDLYSVTFHEIFSRMMKTTENRLGKRIAPMGSSQTVLIEYLDGSTAKATAVLALDCSPKSHVFELDYEDSNNVAVHRLTFTINAVSTYENIEITEKEKVNE